MWRITPLTISSVRQRPWARAKAERWPEGKTYCIFAPRRRRLPAVGLPQLEEACVDELTWDQCAENPEANLADLRARVPAATYRALPSRRRYIPKADGRQRALGIATIEDKIIQAAVVAILTPIYQAEFLRFSYGLRPGRNQHDALYALAYEIRARKIDRIIDADIKSFFDTISQE